MDNTSDQFHKQQADPQFEQNVIKIIKQYLAGSAFTDRQVTDTPTEALSIVNRKFVTQNGTTANRPTSSITGLQYYDTTLNKPVYWSGTTWRDAAGTIV